MKETVPIIEINRENSSIFFPYLLFTIKNSKFIALDCEMSGLGDRKKLHSKSIDERYEAICEAASSRSLLSLGISCFHLGKTKKANKIRLKCVTFNILTFCSNDFVVEPKSLEFLVKHGFDFNLQYAKGVNYYRGPDVKQKTKKFQEKSTFCLRHLFVELILARKPLILHNSLLDLIFLYQNLYGPTPRTIQTFVADLAQMFPAGIYDTKYIADYFLHTSASFLEYIFRKCLRENVSETAERCLSVHFKKFAKFAYDYVVWANCPEPKTQNNENDVEICSIFAFHGHCGDENCQKSHDVDQILNWEDAKIEKKRAKRRRRRDNHVDKNDNSIDFSQEEIDQGSKKTKLVENVNNSCGDFSKLFEIQNSEEEKTKKIKKKEKKSLNSSCETNNFTQFMTPRQVILSELSKKKQKLDEKLLCNSTDAMEIVQNGESSSNADLKKGTACKCQQVYSGVHRAGFDAFMTGFTFAYFSMKFVDWNGDNEEFCLEEFKNKISLSGKDYPLLIQCSAFAKTSSYHDEKFQKLSV